MSGFVGTFSDVREYSWITVYLKVKANNEQTKWYPNNFMLVSR